MCYKLEILSGCVYFVPFAGFCYRGVPRKLSVMVPMGRKWYNLRCTPAINGSQAHCLQLRVNQMCSCFCSALQLGRMCGAPWQLPASPAYYQHAGARINLMICQLYCHWSEELTGHLVQRTSFQQPFLFITCTRQLQSKIDDDEKALMSGILTQLSATDVSACLEKFIPVTSLFRKGENWHDWPSVQLSQSKGTLLKERHWRADMACAAGMDALPACYC